MGKGKVYEFELFRAFAILAVVMIHATSQGVGLLDRQSKIHLIFNFLNKISLYAVPSFIFMSGVVLFYNYYAKWQLKDIVPFYAKRLKFIVIPYLVVSLFYYLFNQRLYYGSVTFDWRHFVSLLPWAKTGYHLYFIIIILQFYVLLPLLLFLVKKFPFVQRYFTWIGIGLFLLFYYINNHYYSFPHRTSLCFTYFAFFFLGASIGMNYAKALASLIKYRVWIGVSAFLTGLGVVIPYILVDYRHIGPQYVFDFFFYSYGVFASLFLLWLAYMIHQRYSKLSTVLQNIGTHSFGIYLIHPALLGLYVMKVKSSGGSIAYFLYFMVSFVVAFGGAYLLTVLIKKFIKPYWVLIGK
jgi:peptidoglycan/LPS O-acetylase OafA/YrhL